MPLQHTIRAILAIQGIIGIPGICASALTLEAHHHQLWIHVLACIRTRQSRTILDLIGEIPRAVIEVLISLLDHRSIGCSPTSRRLPQIDRHLRVTG